MYTSWSSTHGHYAVPHVFARTLYQTTVDDLDLDGENLNVIDVRDEQRGAGTGAGGRMNIADFPPWTPGGALPTDVDPESSDSSSSPSPATPTDASFPRPWEIDLAALEPMDDQLLHHPLQSFAEMCWKDAVGTEADDEQDVHHQLEVVHEGSEEPELEDEQQPQLSRELRSLGAPDPEIFYYDHDHRDADADDEDEDEDKSEFLEPYNYDLGYARVVRFAPQTNLNLRPTPFTDKLNIDSAPPHVYTETPRVFHLPKPSFPPHVPVRDRDAGPLFHLLTTGSHTDPGPIGSFPTPPPDRGTKDSRNSSSSRWGLLATYFRERNLNSKAEARFRGRIPSTSRHGATTAGRV